jgi:hypothetical protein
MAGTRLDQLGHDGECLAAQQADRGYGRIPAAGRPISVLRVRIATIA